MLDIKSNLRHLPMKINMNLDTNNLSKSRIKGGGLKNQRYIFKFVMYNIVLKWLKT